MKIKADFVTNSSSTMFVIEFKEEFRRKDFEEYFTLRTGEYFRLFKDHTSLIRFTQQEEIDWVTKATKTPLKYWGMCKDEYKYAAQILERGSFVAYVEIDRNDYDRRERIEDILRENGGIIWHEGSD